MKTTYPKSGQVTEKDQSEGSKQTKEQFLRVGQPSDLGFCPPSRLYTRDYRVPDEDDATNKDTVSPFVGNPLVW